MKPSYVILNVVLVAGGLFLYHTLVGAPQPTTPGGDYSHLEGDDLLESPRDLPDPVMLDSGADAALSRRNADAIAVLEAKIARLRSRGGDAASGSDEPFARAKDGSLPAMSDLDQVDAEAPDFDDRTLKTLEAYLDEINRRKAEARNRTRLDGELTRLGVDLSDGQRDSVIETTLGYQKKVRTVLQQQWGRDEAGRTARKEALGKLKDEYTTTIHTLVPASEAEKITSSRISRSYGSFFGNNRRGRTKGDRGKR